MLEGKRVIVVGLGKSGCSAVRLCRDERASVIGTDSASLERLGDEVRDLGVPIIAGGHEGVPFGSADLIVVSPGVPLLPELVSAEAQGVPVIGELELAALRIFSPIVAVGGTNGKSTTTTLIGELLRADERSVFVGGNLGTPATEAVTGSHDVVVLEVSSFQLERAPSFHPKVSLLLNVSDDHLDRYASFAAYAAAKGNAFVQQTPEDYSIIPEGDEVCEEQARRGRGTLRTFGPGGDYHVEDFSIVEAGSGERFDLKGSHLFGRHNHENAAAAIAAVRALGVERAAIQKGLSAFVPLPHRMQLAGSIGGVNFYDDSKGTNVGAAVTALLGLSEPRGVLIAGGRDKLGSYDPLVRALEARGRGIVLIGEAAERIASAVGERLPVAHAKDMDEAVRAAFALAKEGDAVLLSPACSSFDMFRSYADRGEHFVRAVERLGAERGEEAR